MPALAPLKLVAGLELHGARRHADVPRRAARAEGDQGHRRRRQGALEIPRATFNELATKGHIADWRAAFEHGDAKATGIEQIIKLIANVVERQEERSRTRRAKTH